MGEKSGLSSGVETSAILLRLPTDLLARLDAYKAAVERETRLLMTRTTLLQRIVAAGLDALEPRPPAMPTARPQQPWDRRRYRRARHRTLDGSRLAGGHGPPRSPHGSPQGDDPGGEGGGREGLGGARGRWKGSVRENREAGSQLPGTGWEVSSLPSSASSPCWG
jgi:hypothetical protein